VVIVFNFHDKSRSHPSSLTFPFEEDYLRDLSFRNITLIELRYYLAVPFWHRFVEGSHFSGFTPAQK
jgi:hypothetical protein